MIRTLLMVLAMNVPAQAGEWTLVWADEFEVDGAPDPSKWGYEEGFVRNREAQWYTRDRRENARVENGVLVLEGRRERWPNPGYDPAAGYWGNQREHAEYTSASIHTRGKFALTYGRIEVRAKLPRGQGVWPAAWTLGANIGEVGWPRCGEIDIMEFVGKAPEHVHATVHYADPASADGKHRMQGSKLAAAAPWEGFHVYAAEWDEQQIRFFYDDQPYHTFALDAAGPGDANPFHKPHYLILNLALGGSWGGEIEAGIFPQRFEVDYVRVYEAENQGSPE